MHKLIEAVVGLGVISLGGLLTLAAHEFGHIVGGWLGRMRFALFVVGPLLVAREGERVRWRLNREWRIAGGMAAGMPPAGVRLRPAYLRFVLGGPLGSLLTAVGALALLVALILHSPHGAIFATPLRMGLFMLGAGSLAIGLGTLIPNRMGGATSDGGRALALLRPGPAAERHAAMLALGAWSVAELPAREWDPAVLETALSIPDGSYDDVVAHYVAYFRALDLDDESAAGEHMRYMLEHAAGTPSAFMTALQAEAAFFEAGYLHDAASARARLDGVGTSMLLEPVSRQRAEAAVLFAEGRREEALALTADIRRQLPRRPGSGRDTLRLLERLERAAEPAGAAR